MSQGNLIAWPERSSTGSILVTLSVRGVTTAGGQVVQTGSGSSIEVVVVVEGTGSYTFVVSGFCVVVLGGSAELMKGQGGNVRLRVVTVLLPCVTTVTGYPIGGKTMLGTGWKEKPLGLSVMMSTFEKGTSVVVTGGGVMVMVVTLTEYMVDMPLVVGTATSREVVYGEMLMVVALLRVLGGSTMTHGALHCAV